MTDPLFDFAAILLAVAVLLLVYLVKIDHTSTRTRVLLKSSMDHERSEHSEHSERSDRQFLEAILDAIRTGNERAERVAEHVIGALHENSSLLRAILHRIPHPTPPASIILGFTDIKENSIMPVPLAAGQTATFSTTPIPSTSAPVASNIVWTSSDTVNAPITPNTADPSGLSVLVAFPSTVVAGVTFSLTVSYTNSDGTLATPQTNSFTTVAPASPDITGFTPIVQSA